MVAILNLNWFKIPPPPLFESRFTDTNRHTTMVIAISALRIEQAHATHLKSDGGRENFVKVIKGAEQTRLYQPDQVTKRIALKADSRMCTLSRTLGSRLISMTNKCCSVETHNGVALHQDTQHTQDIYLFFFVSFFGCFRSKEMHEKPELHPQRVSTQKYQQNNLHLASLEK